MLKLMTERTSRLYWREPVMQDDPVARPVVDSAYAAREFLPSDMHAQTHGLALKIRQGRRDAIRR